MKKYFLILSVLGLMYLSVDAQDKNARYGETLPTTGMVRVFVVFADVVDDTSTIVVPGWNAGQLPLYKDSVIDVVVSSALKSQVTRIYNLASFGALDVVGDYYPYLVSLHNSDIPSGKKCIEAVVDYLNGLGGEIRTNQNLTLADFDNWTLRSGYLENKDSADSKIDVFAVVWRHNSRYRNVRSGGSTGGGMTRPLHGMTGVNVNMNIYTDSVSGCMRHELAHQLLGDNEFHSGGAGAGYGHFLSDIGGYSILSSFNKNQYSYNGWDRWWLGWKHPANMYYISARRPVDMSEVEADLEYGEPLESNEFVLRDFVKYGDAIRIKLPYVRTVRPEADNQYLWIENHQQTLGPRGFDESKPKGIRFNMQIGNDRLDSPNYPESRSNYLVPLSAFGNYDFEYYFDPANAYPGQSNKDRYTARTTSRMENPFAGHHLLMLPAIDFNPVDNKIKNKVHPLNG